MVVLLITDLLLQAMYQLSSTARQLAEQKATLEGQRRAHLAWSGQAMVSNSLNVMQEAVETIRAAFLLPQKDLKCAFATVLLLLWLPSI